MTLQEILDYLNKIYEEKSEISVERFEEIIIELANVVKKQNDLLFEIKNSNIRLENKIKYIENELERSKIYKSIVDVMMEKIRSNPITALLYLYKVKANLDNFSRDKGDNHD